MKEACAAGRLCRARRWSRVRRPPRPLAARPRRSGRNDLFQSRSLRAIGKTTHARSVVFGTPAPRDERDGAPAGAPPRRARWKEKRKERFIVFADSASPALCQTSRGRVFGDQGGEKRRWPSSSTSPRSPLRLVIASRPASCASTTRRAALQSGAPAKERPRPLNATEATFISIFYRTRISWITWSVGGDGGSRIISSQVCFLAARHNLKDHHYASCSSILSPKEKRFRLRGLERNLGSRSSAGGACGWHGGRRRRWSWRRRRWSCGRSRSWRRRERWGRRNSSPPEYPNRPDDLPSRHGLG
jgi:hypothetical protein